MALMPVVNIARLLIREGDGFGAVDVLHRTYRASQLRGTATIRGHRIDMSPLIQTDENHRRICTELWITLLTDDARALARAGRWTEAAETMAAHRGIGNRLLDGRQIMIMSLMTQGLTGQATAMIDSSTPTEPWENTVGSICASRWSKLIGPGATITTVLECAKGRRRARVPSLNSDSSAGLGCAGLGSDCLRLIGRSRSVAAPEEVIDQGSGYVAFDRVRRVTVEEPLSVYGRRVGRPYAAGSASSQAEDAQPAFQASRYRIDSLDRQLHRRRDFQAVIGIGRHLEHDLRLCQRLQDQAPHSLEPFQK